MKISIKFQGLVLRGLLAVGLFGAVQHSWSFSPQLPTVTISATDTNASEAGPNTGTYRVTRTGGDSSLSLVVYFETPTGSAQSGTDYQTLPTYETIPAYASSTNVTLTPILDSNCGESNKTVVLTLADNENYWVGWPNDATVTIADAPADNDSDGDGLPDCWEFNNFGDLNQTGSGNPDGDALTNLQEYQLGSDPNDYYNGALPVLSLVSTNYSVSFASNYLTLSLIARVTDNNGVALSNAPLTFAITNGTARLTTNGALATNLFLRTASGGTGPTWLFLRTDVLVTNQIIVTATSGTNRVQMQFAAWVNDPEESLYLLKTSTNVPPVPFVPAATLYWKNYDDLIHPNDGMNFLKAYDFASNSLWLEITSATNSSATNVTASFTIHTPDASNLYDLFGTTNLSPNVANLNLTNWVWLLRTATGETNLVVPNLWTNQGWFRLGTMLDSDGDGLTDAYEKLVSHTATNVFTTLDTDGDGMPDAWEIAHGLSPQTASAGDDPDGDGLTNLQEYLGGTDALVAPGFEVWVAAPKVFSNVP